MTDEEIRAEINQRLKDGRLPRDYSRRLPVAAGQPGDLGSATTGGSKCSACGADKPHHTYTGNSGDKLSFHEKCERIWNEERVKLISD